MPTQHNYLERIVDADVDELETLLDLTLGLTMPKELIGMKTVWQDGKPTMYFIQRGMTAPMRFCARDVVAEIPDNAIEGTVKGRVVDLIAFFLKYFPPTPHPPDTKQAMTKWSLFSLESNEAYPPILQWTLTVVQNLRTYSLEAQGCMTYSPDPAGSPHTLTYFEIEDGAKHE